MLIGHFLIKKTIPCIIPLFHNNTFISKFRDKAELFNTFFADQCTLINNSSEIPATLNIKATKTIPVTGADITKIIKNLNQNKAHGHDMVSIRVVKLCGNSVLPPLEPIFKSCLERGTFPSEWEKADVVPVHKKGDKQSLKNYHSMSLFLICEKIERLIYNKIFEYFIENDLISRNQSGFKRWDLYIKKLLSITHEIYKPFDEGYETRGVFLDISKASDKV